MKNINLYLPVWFCTNTLAHESLEVSDTDDVGGGNGDDDELKYKNAIIKEIFKR